jgi:hypothetical protein
VWFSFLSNKHLSVAEQCNIISTMVLLGISLPWLVEVGIGVEIEGDKKEKGRGFRST